MNGQPLTPDSYLAFKRYLATRNDLVALVSGDETARLLARWVSIIGFGLLFGALLVLNIANYGSGLAVMLRHGQADLPRLQADLGRLYGDRADEVPREIFLPVCIQETST